MRNLMGFGLWLNAERVTFELCWLSTDKLTVKEDSVRSIAYDHATDTRAPRAQRPNLMEGIMTQRPILPIRVMGTEE
jgi:hypothetical protein